MYPIITISREVGSEGHTIGEMVAQELDIPLLDKDFILKIAGTMDIKEKVVEQKSEYLSRFEKYLNTKTYMGRYISDEQDDIFRIQKDIILEQAAKGPCVIVGRCADYILAKAGIPTLNVFIHADMTYRKEVYRKRYPDVEEDILYLMIRKDKGRIGYYRYYTDREWGDMNNYELCLDSGKLGLDLCTQLIVAAAKARA